MNQEAEPRRSPQTTRRQVRERDSRGRRIPYEGARRIWLEVANEGMDDEELWRWTSGFVNDAADSEEHPDWRGPELEETIRSRPARSSTVCGTP